MLLAPYVCFHIFSKVKVTEWPPIGKIAAHSAYEMFLWYKYLDPVVQSIVSLNKFVKQISAKLTNTLLFLLKKCENPLQCKGFSHFFNKK